MNIKNASEGRLFCFKLEARVGIEPTHGAFAEPGLTTWLPRLTLTRGHADSPHLSFKGFMHGLSFRRIPCK